MFIYDYLLIAVAFLFYLVYTCQYACKSIDIWGSMIVKIRNNICNDKKGFPKVLYVYFHFSKAIPIPSEKIRFFISFDQLLVL